MRGLGGRLGSGLSTFAGLVLAGIMMVSVVDVVGRYIFRQPLPGSSEITEILMAVLIYAGLPVVSQRGAHICVDLFPIGGETADRIRHVVIGVICALVLALISWRLWVYADQIRGTNDVTEYLKLPQAPFAYIHSVFAGLTAAIELYRASTRAPPPNPTAADSA